MAGWPLRAISGPVACVLGAGGLIPLAGLAGAVFCPPCAMGWCLFVYKGGCGRGGVGKGNPGGPGRAWGAGVKMGVLLTRVCAAVWGWWLVGVGVRVAEWLGFFGGRVWAFEWLVGVVEDRKRQRGIFGNKAR